MSKTTEVGVIAGPGHLVQGRDSRNPADVQWAKDNGYWYPEPTEYWRCLKLGDRVIETAPTCYYGRGGVIVKSSTRDPCVLSVRWDRAYGEEGWMTTSVTFGTRKVKDALR